MAIPVYSPITDAEIEPGDDALSTVFIRLRDNPLAILGVDTADPSPRLNPASSLICIDGDNDSNALARALTAGTASEYTPWLTIADDAEVGEFSTFLIGATADLERVAFGQRSDLSCYQYDLDVAWSGFVSSMTRYFTWIAPIYSGNAFTGVRVQSASGVGHQDNTTTSIDSSLTRTGLLYNSPGGDVAPGSTTSLLKTASGSGYAEVLMEHQTSSGLQQVRFHGVTSGSFNRAGYNLSWVMRRFHLRVKG